MDCYENLNDTVIDGRYKILCKINSGGMAVVFKAEDILMGRTVALKVLLPEEAEKEESLIGFTYEAKACAALTHDNIVRIYDICLSGKLKYIVMEYLDGIDFAEFISKSSVITWKNACNYVLQLLDALEYAHSHGVVHRDIKPKNIMLLSKDKKVVLTDFGIAKLSKSGKSDSNSNIAVGTASYMSPEQVLGDEVDRKTDIYSLGILFYETVVGECPFVSETPEEVLRMQVEKKPETPTERDKTIPRELSDIIMKSLEKSPAARYSDAAEMAEDIRKLLKAKENESDGTICIIDETGDSVAENSIKLGRKEKKIRSQERHRNKERNSFFSTTSRSMFPIISGVTLAFILVFLAVGGYSAYTVLMPILVGETETGVDVVVPNLVGKHWDDVKYPLQNGDMGGDEKIKFQIDPENIVTEYNSHYEYGTVISQTPKGGSKSKLPDGQTYYQLTSLVISLGKELVTVPDLMYCSKVSAVAQLKNLGLIVKIEQRTDQYANPEQILSVYPEAGTQLEVGETVTIVVCSSDEMTTTRMPRLLGKTFEEAQQLLAEANIVLGKVTERNSTTEPTGTVLEQSIAQYTEIQPYSTVVDIVVSVYTPEFEMISVLGMTEAEATIALIELGLQIEYVTSVPSTAPHGTVVSQSISVGTPVSEGTGVVLTLSYNPVMPDIPQVSQDPSTSES